MCAYACARVRMREQLHRRLLCPLGAAGPPHPGAADVLAGGVAVSGAGVGVGLALKKG